MCCKLLKCGVKATVTIWALAFNLTIGLIGVVFLVFGGFLTHAAIDTLVPYITVITDPTSEENPLARAEFIILTLVGCILLLSAVLGLLGICCANKCFSIVLVVAKVICSCSQILIIVLVSISMISSQSGLQKKMELQISYGYTGTGSTLDVAWEHIQTRFECCGANSYSDWYAGNYGQVPRTCCGVVDNTKPPGTDYVNVTLCEDTFNTPPQPIGLPDDDIVNTKGCYEEVSFWIKQKSTIILGLTVLLYAVQLADVIVSCICCPVKKVSGVD